MRICIHVFSRVPSRVRLPIYLELPCPFSCLCLYSYFVDHTASYVGDLNKWKLCFYASIQDIQVTLREEIKSACEYRPFEKCDYIARISNEICCEKLEHVISELDGMKKTIDEHHSASWSHIPLQPWVDLLKIVASPSLLQMLNLLLSFGPDMGFSCL